MDSVVIAAIAGIGLLAAIVVFFSLRQTAREAAAMERFAASHGWTFLKRDDSRVTPILDQVDPDQLWYPYHIVLVAGPPESVYLFQYTSRPRGGGSVQERGFACLAEHTSRGSEIPVFISRRVPLVEKLMGDVVEVGGPEFRREYTVECRQAGAASALMTTELQQILLEHASGAQWFLVVRIAGRRVLVTSRWAEGAKEWDYLITMTKRLRQAIR